MGPLLGELNALLDGVPPTWSVIVILIVVAAWLIAREKKINRPTVEKLLRLIRWIVFLLIGFEISKYFVGFLWKC
jgi:hypothetical protein